MRHDPLRRRRAHRAARALRGRGLAVLPGRRAGCRDHPRHHRRRAGQSHLRARGRLPGSARPGARRPQQRGHRDRAGQAPCAGGIVPAPGRARPRHPRGLRGDGAGAAPDHADRLRPRHLRRDPPPARELRASGAFGREGHRTARCHGARSGHDRQPGIRHLLQRTAHPAGRRPARRGHLGHRAGGGGRGAAHRLRLRLRLQRRSDHAVPPPVHLLPGRRLRRRPPLLPPDRPRRLGQRSRASPPGRM